MANFVYNPHRSGGSLGQWYEFKQKESFNNDLISTFQAEASSISNSISDSTNEIVGVFDKGFDVVTDALGSGFSDISLKLGNIDSSIENLALMLDWRLSEVINQQKISNLLLGNIALLLRVPDFQKERQYYIEQGFKHLKNASIDSDLYEDALKNLLEAENRETTDYIVLYQIGMIYLHSKKKETEDFPKAENYFRRAAKYSIVESNPEAIKTLNILAGDVNQNISTTAAAKEFAAKSYFQAGVACYVQGKFPEAIELSEKAFSLSPTLLEAGFLQSKSLAVLGNGDKSAEILRGLIVKERFYSVKTISDADLANRPEVQSMLIKLREEAVEKASEKFLALTTENILNEEIKALFLKIEILIQKHTYLDALNALDELTKKRVWQIEGFDEILYERFLQNNPDLKVSKNELNNLFNKFRQNNNSEDILVKSYQNKHTHNIEEFIFILREIDFLIKQKEIKRQQKVIQRQKQIEFDQKSEEEYEKERLRRLEEDGKQINEFILQAQREEGRNRNLAISLYEKAAKLGSWEAGQKLQTLRGKIQYGQDRNPISELLDKAKEEEELQNRKWLFKDYDLAIYYYEEAAKLGSYEAKQKLQELRKS